MSAREKQQFHAAMRGTSRNDPPAPPHVVELWRAANVKGAKDKLTKIRDIMMKWKLDRTWGNKVFEEKRLCGRREDAEEIQDLGTALINQVRSLDSNSADRLR